MYKKSIDYVLCNLCMKCEKICKNSHVIEKNEKGLPEFKNNLQCIYCGHCLSICPQHAISFELLNSHTSSGSEYFAKPIVLDSTRKPSDEDTMLEFLYSTRSCRYFLEKPVEKEKLQKVIDVMARAPSAGNEQNRNFYIIQNKEQIDKLEKAINTHYSQLEKVVHNPIISGIMAFNGAKIITKESDLSRLPFKEQYKAMYNLMKNGFHNDTPDFSYLLNTDVVVIITSDKKGSMMHKDFYKGDIRITGTYGILAAKALGLDSCWLGLTEIAMNKNKKIQSMFNIKSNERIDGILALGYSDLKWEQAPPRGPVKTQWL